MEKYINKKTCILNQIQDLKQQSGNEGAIRVAYSLKESKDRAKPAFLIDDSTLGQSKIIIIHSKSINV